VADLGWTDDLVDKAAVKAAVDPGMAYLAFPEGWQDLLHFASQEEDKALLGRLQSADLTSMKIRERVTYGVRSRIEAMNGHKGAVKRTMAILALPQNAALGTKLLYGTVDTIWYGIGDTSTDYNFYSKRAILAGVYSSTVLHWLEDESEAAEETWAFLDRRIEDVMQFEKVKGKTLKFISSLPSPLSFLSK
jgi:ubiquinone biosynthesis protein COQ9